MWLDLLLLLLWLGSTRLGSDPFGFARLASSRSAEPRRAPHLAPLRVALGVLGVTDDAGRCALRPAPHAGPQCAGPAALLPTDGGGAGRGAGRGAGLCPSSPSGTVAAAGEGRGRGWAQQGMEGSTRHHTMP